MEATGSDEVTSRSAARSMRQRTRYPITEVPAFSLKRSANAERDMRARWANFCTVQRCPGSWCIAVIAAPNCGSASVDSQPAWRLKPPVACKRRISSNINCARYSPWSTLPGCGSRSTAIRRCKHHCKAVQSTELSRCSSGGSTSSKTFECSLANEKSALSKRHSPPPCHVTTPPFGQCSMAEERETAGTAGSLAMQNPGALGRTVNSPAFIRIGAGAPSTMIQHVPDTSAKHIKPSDCSSRKAQSRPASRPTDL